MLCEKCGNTYREDLTPDCPFCFDQPTPREEQIIEKYGLEISLVKDIIASKADAYLGDNMYIDISGDVHPADDEEDLRNVIFEDLMTGDTQLDEISDIFVDGKRKRLEFDIKFVDEE